MQEPGDGRHVVSERRNVTPLLRVLNAGGGFVTRRLADVSQYRS
jgi:hypothetical protein